MILYFYRKNLSLSQIWYHP